MRVKSSTKIFVPAKRLYFEYFSKYDHCKIQSKFSFTRNEKISPPPKKQKNLRFWNSISFDRDEYILENGNGLQMIPSPLVLKIFYYKSSFSWNFPCHPSYIFFHKEIYQEFFSDEIKMSEINFIILCYSVNLLSKR